MGSDGAEEAHAGGSSDFNPRSPCGERLFDSVGSMESVKFQSTLPVGGATVLLKQSHDIIRISIHAPCVGSDHGPQGVPGAKGEFQSTLPVWGATMGIR